MSRAEWLRALDSASRRPDLSRDIARMLDRGVADPPAFIASLFERAAVTHSLTAAASPVCPRGFRLYKKLWTVTGSGASAMAHFRHA